MINELNSNEKKYLIKKVESYNNQISEENREIVGNVIWGGLAGIGTIVCFVTGNEAFMSGRQEWAIGLFSIGTLNAFGVANIAKATATSIAQKVGLENRIEDIKDLLELEQINENERERKR